MTLDQKLTRLRKQHGLSQADVSEQLTVSRQAVSRWENGAVRPSTENLQYLSKIYHVSLEYLLDDTADEGEEPEICQPGEQNAPPLASPSRKALTHREKVILIAGICIVLAAICILIAVFVAAKPKRTTTRIEDTIKENIDDVPRVQFEIEW